MYFELFASMLMLSNNIQIIDLLYPGASLWFDLETLLEDLF